jgi:hypothetical protein
MDDQQFLSLVTEVAKVAKPMHKDTVVVDEMDTPWPEFEIDSLDCIMIFIYMCDIYGVPEEVGKTLMAKTPRDLQRFLDQNKTKEPTNIQEAVESIK